MSAVALRIAPARLLVWPVTLVTLVLVAAGTGLVAPVVPLLGVIALAVLLATPMQTTALALLAFALVVDNPGERPMDGKWDSPLAVPDGCCT